MEQATIGALLTESEWNEVRKKPMFIIQPDQKLCDMTWHQLSEVSLILINTEYSGQMKQSMPHTCLAAESINILTRRAIEKKLFLYK